MHVQPATALIDNVQTSRLLSLSFSTTTAATTGRGAHLSQEILACVLPLLQGATIGGALGHPGPTDVRVHGTSDKPTSAARIVYSLKIAEAGSEPSSTILITWWSLAERWKTDVKIVLTATHFHSVGVALAGPWDTVEKRTRRSAGTALPLA